MGKFDSYSRQYFSDNERFADIFNFKLFGGSKVITPDMLQELDPNITVFFDQKSKGNQHKLDLRRDISKLWIFKEGSEALYALACLEEQSYVNYAMPLRMGLYDFSSYYNQMMVRKNFLDVLHAKRKKGEDLGEYESINPRSGEFLSGWLKTDKLKPIFSIVVFLSDEPWDGPTELFQMFPKEFEPLFHFLNNWKLNIISPADLSNDDLFKFNTGLGSLFCFLKYYKTTNDFKNMPIMKSVDKSSVKLMNLFLPKKMQLPTTGEVDVIDEYIAFLPLLGKEFQDQFNESQKELHEFKNKLHESENRFNESQKELHEFKNRFHESQKECQGLKDTIQKLQRELAMLRKES